MQSCRVAWNTGLMPDTPPRTITLDGIRITLVVERKRVKNVNARLEQSTLSVSAPLDLPQETLEPIIADLARKLVRRQRQRRVNSEEDALGLARRVAARFPHPPQIDRVLFVTTQRARWGSYSPRTSTIRLHSALREMPRWVLEAVVAHELAHVSHPDHSPAFWKLLRETCPDTDRATAFLAGVAWLGQRWEGLPPVERSLLTGVRSCEDEPGEPGCAGA